MGYPVLKSLRNKRRSLLLAAYDKTLNFNHFVLLFQICLTLSVAEVQLKFEHRDLHWGNILIAPTKEKVPAVPFKWHIIHIPTCGIKVSKLLPLSIQGVHEKVTLKKSETCISRKNCHFLSCMN